MRTHLDLFSGIGGFSIAAQMAGFKTVAFCEIEPYAQQILKEKFGAVMADTGSGKGCQRYDSDVFDGRSEETEQVGMGGPRLHPDIFKLNGRDYAGVDLVTGGFPCQPFSCAGKRRGKEDDRHLWPEMLRVIAEAGPAWVLGENVAGIITMELDGVLSDLENIGYSAWPLVIPAVAVDARHRRDRVWIMAHHEECRSGARFCETETKQDRNQHSNCGGDVPDTHRTGPQGRDCGKLQERSGEWTARSSSPCCVWPDEAEWFPQSPICRVADGIPNRAHRLRGLGNAIVPQVAYEILKAIPL